MRYAQSWHWSSMSRLQCCQHVKHNDDVVYDICYYLVHKTGGYEVCSVPLFDCYPLEHGITKYTDKYWQKAHKGRYLELPHCHLIKHYHISRRTWENVSVSERMLQLINRIFIMDNSRVWCQLSPKLAVYSERVISHSTQCITKHKLQQIRTYVKRKIQ